MLKYRIQNLEDVEEQYRALYKPADDGGGGFICLVDGAVDKSKLDEFRNNNRKLHGDFQKASEDLKKYEGVDLEEYQRLQEQDRQLKEQQLLKSGDVEGVVQQRLREQARAFENETAQLKRARDESSQQASTYRDELSRMKIENAAQQAAQNVGRVRPGALQDIINRARMDWEIDADGNMKSKARNKKGDPFIDMQEWAEELLTTAAYFWEPAGGGGAGGGGGKGTNKPGPKTIPNDPVLIGKHSKEIMEGTVVVEGFNDGNKND